MASSIDKNVGYRNIITKIFFDHFNNSGVREFEFLRKEIISARDEVAPELEGLNPGDVIYSFRYRKQLPSKILATQPTGLEWIIEGAGRSRYRFRLVPSTRILPNPALKAISVPDATPEIIRAHKLNDEQALLAIVRYNRLIDIFLGLTTYSLQNHLRTTVRGVGQIEIDELYVGLDTKGRHHIIPVQAKGGTDQIGVVQISQDIRFSEQKFPDFRCHSVATQSMDDGVIALFELTLEGEDVRIVDERHYRLAPATDLDPKAIRDF